MPPLVSGAPLMLVGVEVTVPLPTCSSAAAGTEVTVPTSAVRPAPVGPGGSPALPADPLLPPCSSTKASTTATTATIAPPASSSRFRRCARCAAARCAAIRVRRSPPGLALLAFPIADPRVNYRPLLRFGL